LRESLLNYWAQTLFFFGLNERALRAFQVLAREYPSRGDAWAILGYLHAERGELSEAVPAFEKAVALKADDAELLFNAGFATQRAGNHERAMTLMRRVLELDPKLDRAWYGLGLSLAHAGRHEEAVEKFREAARLQPFNPYAGYHLAAELAKLGRRDEVRAEYERVKQFDPKISDLMRRELGLDP
jgi:Flp pilus assembly protein TadD